jgi:DNA-binding response OmpR family regulator
MKILLAEDEKELSRAVTAILEHAKYSVDAAYNGVDALELSENNAYDVMIFDIMMPKMDGIELLKRIRESGNYTPVILLTAKSEIDDRITGLDAGADDYLTKPFAMGELLARLRSMTRRNTSYMPTKLQVGSVILDTEEQEMRSENSVRLAGKEARLMEFLMQNVGKSISTEELFGHIWGKDKNAELQIVWMYICFLRNKLRSINADIIIEGQENGSFTLHKNAEG